MVTALTDTEIQSLLAQGRRYKSKLVVRAEQLMKETVWSTGAGDEMRGQAGDWKVADGNDQWTVAADVFDRTYTRVDGEYFRKEAAVLAVNVDHAFAVGTLEGLATGAAGDWLVQNPGGECWPVPASVFERHYEEA